MPYKKCATNLQIVQPSKSLSSKPFCCQCPLINYPDNLLKLNPNINECEDEDSEEPSRLVIADVNPSSISCENGNGNNHETAVKITNNNTEQHHQGAAHPPPPHFAVVASL